MINELSPVNPILMIDDEEAWLQRLAFTLEYEAGINNIIRCSDSRKVPEIMRRQPVSLVLLDLTMPHISGQDVLEMLVENYPQTPVIILSGLNQIDVAVDCIKKGAFDYFVKTEKWQRLQNGISRAISFAELHQENQFLRQSVLRAKLERSEAFKQIVTNNKQMIAIFSYLEAIAASREPVLITGESGVGKELIAQAIHHLHGQNFPLVALNTAGLDDNAFSDTLFGHVRGAFTGAEKERSGLIEKAAGGVLFLDEIGDLSLPSQVKLLRFLQEGEYYPLGSDMPKKAQVRLIFATNHNLEKKRDDSSFRNDLYFRLCSHHVHIPPLRERREDIPLLLDHYITAAAKALGQSPPQYPRELEILLKNYSFPGNVRELRALVFNAVSVHRGGMLSLKAFNKILKSEKNPNELQPVSAKEMSLASADVFPSLSAMTEMHIAEALRRANNNQGIAAGLLGISRQALNKRLNKKKG